MSTTPTKSEDVGARVQEILKEALNAFYDYITEHDIIKAADEYSNKTIPAKAKAQILQLIEEARIEEVVRALHLPIFEGSNDIPSSHALLQTRLQTLKRKGTNQ